MTTIQRWFGDAASQDIGPVIEEDVDLRDEFGSATLPGNASYAYVNETGESDEFMTTALSTGRTVDGRPVRDEIASALDQWQRSINSPSIAQGSLFFRNRYTMTTNVFDQMAQCADAVEFDEILGSVCDATEGLAFSRANFEMVDQDQEDVWNQIAEEIDLDSRLREMWRDLFKVSQFYVAIDWQQKVYKVRTKQVPMTALEDDPPLVVAGSEDLHPSGVPNPGPKKRARRKQFVLTAPAGITILDPTKVLPVGQLMFGKERFAYIASHEENEAFMKVFAGEGVDPLVLKLFDGPYVGTAKEMSYITEEHKGRTNKAYLWLFKQDACFRHTLSRAQYERFAAIRLKSCLPILEMKAHLRASDRSALIGATNFIVVLKRGSDKFPARAGEVEQLREQARVVARMPILVGDHRLSVEIITPQTDFVLDQSRYNILDERLIMRGLNTFSLPGSRTNQATTGGAAGSGLDEQVARGIESRRFELARTLQDKIVRATLDKNEAVLSEVPTLSFHPKRVAVTLDPDIMKLVLQLRDRGDISRETELEEFNYDQEVEYTRRKREKGIDPTFGSSVPYSSPGTNPFTTGNAGGRPAGGGGVGNDSTPAAGGNAPTTPQN
jgi:hypothetical protein